MKDAHPCPFCASGELSILNTVGDADALVHCEGCGANGPLVELNGRDPVDVDLDHEAVEQWNRRDNLIIIGLLRQLLAEHDAAAAMFSAGERPDDPITARIRQALQDLHELSQDEAAR